MKESEKIIYMHYSIEDEKKIPNENELMRMSDSSDIECFVNDDHPLV